MVGVHKRNVSPQNHFHEIILNDHYTYEVFYLIIYFLIGTHIFLD
jgi:hypothetical protein